MLSAKDIAIVYETLLLSPGMNEPVKVSLQLPRKSILLLSKIIEWGVAAGLQNSEQNILSIAGKESVNELSLLSTDLLIKAGLQEMNSRLTALSAK